MLAFVALFPVPTHAMFLIAVRLIIIAENFPKE
jgi:hypothetical protein